jgi:hypothetical protein
MTYARIMVTKRDSIFTVNSILAQIIIPSGFENHGHVASEVCHMCLLVLDADSLEGIPVLECWHKNSQ